MVLCVVLILALQSLLPPVASSGWRPAETGERHHGTTHGTTQLPSGLVATAEPTVNISFVARPSLSTVVDPVANLFGADTYVVQTPGAAVRAASLYGVQTRPAAEPYVVLGVATSPRNTGHRAWIRETWMTLPNVVSSSILSFFVVRHSNSVEFGAVVSRERPNPAPWPWS